MSQEKLSTLTTKLPRDLREQFAALAKRRNLTTSALLRSLVDRELAGRPDDVVGDVERAVFDELTDRDQDHTSARAAAALNMARRLDRDPTAGAANAAQLRALLADLAPTTQLPAFDGVHWLRLSHQFRRRGWLVVDETGHRFDIGDVDDALRTQVFAELGEGVRHTRTHREGA